MIPHFPMRYDYKQNSFYRGSIMNTKRNLLIAGIAAAVLIAVVALVMALKSDKSGSNQEETLLLEKGEYDLFELVAP